MKTRLRLLGFLLGLMGLAACGGSGAPVAVIEPDMSSSACVENADCTEGFACEEGACVESIVPENPEPPVAPESEPEPEPEPEPETDPLICLSNDECASGKCSAETSTCVASCPIGTLWKTPVGETKGACEALGLTLPVPPPPPPGPKI